ncbi:MAG TPA: agmatine deiminase family protein, partial [Clostridiales bacterium]|nr:agmatine deiminase family protein [Clostridiales bacterium]
MKKLIPMLIILLSAVIFAQTKIDDELIRRTEEWFKNNPNSMPHWLTPDELGRMNEIGKGFVETDPPVGPVRQTAEFERMQGVMIGAHKLEKDKGFGFGLPIAFIKQLSEVTDVVTIVASTSEKNTVINSYISAGIDTSKCDFLIAPSDSYWTRDYGPWYVVNGNNEVGICDFPYNRPRTNDDNIPVVTAPFLDEPLYGMNVVHTGGNYMTDGMGVGASTTIVYEESNTSLHINQAQVDQRMNDYLGIHTYHVVEDPNNTYIDHIDCWGKFLDVDKLLIRSVPTSHAQYDEIEATVDYFEAQTSSYGTPYQIYRVNTPNNEPYTNSLILNDHVFVPIMSGSNDAAALAVYQSAMPGYTITGVLNSTGTPWESTDALHCRTRGVIDKEMLHIYHVATLTEQSSAESYPISAKIVSYGGHTITSATLYYKINSGSWNTISMSGSSGNYSATIPSQAAGSTVSYYIHATDNSGRVENHPFIGSADPHQFNVLGQIGGTFAVNQSSLNYGNVSVGQSSIKQFTITNSDAVEYLSGEITTIAGYSVAAAVKNTISYMISPNSSETFDLTFAPTLEQAYSGNVVITSSDTSHPSTNIAVSGSGTVPVFGLPFTQNFNASTSLPTSWTIVDNQGNGQVWQFGTHTSGLGGTPGNYAYLNSDGFGSGNSQNCDLVTPKINMSSGTNVTLAFTHYFRFYTGSSATLSYSINGGSSWTVIQTWTASTANPATFSQVINALDGQANVKLKWN